MCPYFFFRRILRGDEILSSIYIYDGPFEKGEKGYGLIRQAAVRYCGEAGVDYPVLEAEILREVKGKPYFVDIPLEFSLSHSGALWMCMVSQQPCGLDLQHVKDCKHEEIARRLFTEEEQHYVALWGQEGFFDVWVRKEALCKCTGQGIFSDMPSVVSKNSDLMGVVSWHDREYFFTEIEIAPDIKCAACTDDEAPVVIRVF